MANLSNLVGTMTYDGLVAETYPSLTGAGTIAALSTAATLKRGTLFAINASGKLEVMASGGTADCILVEDTEVGTSADVAAAVYVAGCFNPDKLIVADGYTLTATDAATLRGKGIYLKAAQA